MKLKDTGLTKDQIKGLVDKYMIETYERMDFLAETAKDQYIYDENGEAYLDFYAGIAVNSAGNCNEKVVAAVKDQVEDIMHTFNYPYTIPQALLAEKVCTTIGMDKIFYQNSGTEANEAMIKMARKYGIEKYGPNKLREKKKKTKLQRFADQFKDVMILILIAAAIISFVVACTEGNPKEFFCPLLGRCLTFQAAGNILHACRRAPNRNYEVSRVTLYQVENEMKRPPSR